MSRASPPADRLSLRPIDRPRAAEPHRRPRLYALLFTAVCATAATAGGAQSTSAPPKVQLVSPESDSYVAGPTTLYVTAEPFAAVSSVVFFADGREVCTIARPPFKCEWDAGPTVAEHQIRAVVNLTAGGRVVQVVRTKGIEFADSASVEAVQVPVTVLRRGRFVEGVPRESFRVSEDGRRQTISSFVSEDVPLELVVAIDISNSLSLDMPQVKAAVKAFLGAVPTKDRVTLLGFNDTIFTLARRETDADARLKAVEGLNPFGRTALYDVILHGVDLLDQQPGKKALVVFTDGEDQGSRATRVDVERRLSAGDTMVYTIAQGRGARVNALKKLLEELAEPTGGRAVVTEDVDGLQRVFTELLEELSHQYLIGYVPTDTTTPPDKWRAIKVEVSGYDVRARKGYLPAARPVH